jgi:hypothetical protein
MKRRTFDGIVTAVGFGLAVFLMIAAGLLNWGASFANDSVQSQLANQNIAFPAADAMLEAIKDKLAKWAEQQVTTGEIAKYGELRQTLFMGNTLRGMLLEAYAFGTLGVIAGYAALAALAGGLIMLILSIAGLFHLRRTPMDATI